MTNSVLKHIVLVITQINKLEASFGKAQEQRIREQVPGILAESDIILNYDPIFVYYHNKQPNGLEGLNEFLRSKDAFVP